jgi:hypothetical protein
MPLNMPTVTRDDISFGPARLFLGAAGATPTVDVGAIGEDGVTLEVTSENKDVFQGNPKLIEFSFATQQMANLKVTSIEWNFDNLKYAIGAGNTSSSGTFEKFAFGGEPCIEDVALHVQHQMCRTGDTLNIYIWRAQAAAAVSIPFTADDVHSFEYNWKALRADTDWAGNSLADDEQLFQILRQI